MLLVNVFPIQVEVYIVKHKYNWTTFTIAVTNNNFTSGPSFEVFEDVEYCKDIGRAFDNIHMLWLYVGLLKTCVYEEAEDFLWKFIY